MPFFLLPPPFPPAPAQNRRVRRTGGGGGGSRPAGPPLPLPRRAFNGNMAMAAPTGSAAPVAPALCGHLALLLLLAAPAAHGYSFPQQHT